MKNKIKQLLYTTADWTFEALVVVVDHILRFQVKVIKHFFRLTWKMLKFTAWSMAQKNFWKGLLFSIPATAFCVLLALTLSYFKPYTGTYFGHQNKILSDKEKRLYNTVIEYEKRKKELDLLEGLKNNNRDAIVEYIKVKFGSEAKTALAVAKCESNINARRVGDGHLTFISNGVEYGKSYGVFQIRHLQGRPNPEQLKDARFNIDYAYNLKQKQGWKPWTCFAYGYYQKHLSSL